MRIRTALFRRLWRNEEDCKANEPSQNVFKTGIDSKIKLLWAFRKPKHISKDRAPSSYPSVADKVKILRVMPHCLTMMI